MGRRRGPHPDPPPLRGGGRSGFDPPAPSPAKRGRVGEGAEASERRDGARETRIGSDRTTARAGDGTTTRADDLAATRAGDGAAIGDGARAARLTRLLAWLSPSFPTGAFSYSHGLEAAVEAGLVRDLATLVEYVATALERGAGRLDAAFLAAARRALDAGDDAALLAAAARAAATRGSAELALESRAQGEAFLAAIRAAWPSESVERAAAALAVAGIAPVHPVAVAIAAASAGIAPPDALAGFLHAFAANLVSAGVRLIPLGQTDGQRALAALEATVAAAAARAALPVALDALGAAAPLIDLLSMRHETQYTRLFRS